MKKTIKSVLIILVLLFVFILSGCELSIQDVKEQYDVTKEIEGTELTTEEILEKFENILKDFENVYYAEMIMEGIYGEEAANAKLQFDFSSDKIKNYKFYFNITSPEEQMTVFLDKEILYVESIYQEEVVKEKGTITEILGEVSNEEIKEELLDEVMSYIGMDLLFSKETYEELIDTFKGEFEKNQDFMTVKIDSDGSLIIDYIQDSGQGRVVFNKDNKLIYIGLGGSNINMSVTINYNKPNIKIPSKDGYQDAEVE